MFLVCGQNTRKRTVYSARPRRTVHFLYNLLRPCPRARPSGSGNASAGTRTARFLHAQERRTGEARPTAAQQNDHGPFLPRVYLGTIPYLIHRPTARSARPDGSRGDFPTEEKGRLSRLKKSDSNQASIFSPLVLPEPESKRRAGRAQGEGLPAGASEGPDLRLRRGSPCAGAALRIVL